MDTGIRIGHASKETSLGTMRHLSDGQEIALLAILYKLRWPAYLRNTEIDPTPRMCSTMGITTSHPNAAPTSKSRPHPANDRRLHALSPFLHIQTLPDLLRPILFLPDWTRLSEPSRSRQTLPREGVCDPVMRWQPTYPVDYPHPFCCCEHLRVQLVCSQQERVLVHAADCCVRRLALLAETRMWWRTQGAGDDRNRFLHDISCCHRARTREHSL